MGLPRVSSPVTVAGQRRICTVFPGGSFAALHRKPYLFDCGLDLSIYEAVRQARHGDGEMTGNRGRGTGTATAEAKEGGAAAPPPRGFPHFRSARWEENGSGGRLKVPRGPQFRHASPGCLCGAQRWGTTKRRRGRPV